MAEHVHQLPLRRVPRFRSRRQNFGGAWSHCPRHRIFTSPASQRQLQSPITVAQPLSPCAQSTQDRASVTALGVAHQRNGNRPNFRPRPSPPCTRPSEAPSPAHSASHRDLSADPFLQAHRVIINAVLIGGRILGRSFAAAYKQAQAASNYQRAQAKLNPNGTATGRSNIASGMTLDEAYKILNVKPPQGAGSVANAEEVMDRFKRLFDANDPKKGGSFYLQSKVLRARERLEAEIGPVVEKMEQQAAAKEGLPKMYKDR